MRNKKITVFDIDDTLLDCVGKILEFHNNEYKTNFKREDILFYELWKTFGNTREQTIQEILNFYDSIYFDNIIPLEGAKEVLDALGQNGFENVISTMRPKKIESKTNVSLRKNFGNAYSYIHYSTSFFGGSNETKAEFCERIGAVFIVEDSLENCLNCSSKGIPSYLINQPWNQNGNLKNTLITRVNKLSEILEKEGMKK